MESLIYIILLLIPMQPDQDGMIDPNFYLEPRFEYEGHLWRPILMEHHPECSCQNQTK